MNRFQSRQQIESDEGLDYVSYTPNELGLNGVNLKAAAGTKYWSPLLDLRRATGRVKLRIETTTTGGASTGTAQVIYQAFDKYGNQAGPELTLCLGVNAIVSTSAVMSYGAGDAAAVVNCTTSQYGQSLPLGFCKLALKVQVQSDAATSSIASLWVDAGK